MTISHSQYHKHGAYLLRYSDLPGFSQQFQRDLATLVRGHRRKFAPAIFESADPEDIPRLRYLCVLLRLAVLIQHPRNQEAPPDIRLYPGSSGLPWSFPRAGLTSDR